VVVGIDLSETAAKVKEWKARKKVTYPLFIDVQGTSLSLFGQDGIPTNLILDKQRKLRYVRAGFDANGMKQVLDGLVR
jgi:hypothetical protein